jgi:hypothetical protein
VTVPTGASESDAFKIQASGKAAAGQIALSVAAVSGAGNTNVLIADPYEVKGVVLKQKKQKKKNAKLTKVGFLAKVEVVIEGPQTTTSLHTDYPAEGGPVVLTPTCAQLTFIPASVTVLIGESESEPFKIQASGKAAAGQIALSVAAVGGAGNTNNLSANPFEVQGVVLKQMTKVGFVDKVEVVIEGPQITTSLHTDYPAEGGPVVLTPTCAELTFIPASVTVRIGENESEPFKIQVNGKAVPGRIALSVAAVGGAGNTNVLIADPYEVKGMELKMKDAQYICNKCFFTADVHNSHFTITQGLKPESERRCKTCAREDKAEQSICCVCKRLKGTHKFEISESQKAPGNRICMACPRLIECGRCLASKTKDSFSRNQRSKLAHLPKMCSVCIAETRIMTASPSMMNCTGKCGKNLPKTSFATKQRKKDQPRCRICTSTTAIQSIRLMPKEVEIQIGGTESQHITLVTNAPAVRGPIQLTLRSTHNIIFSPPSVMVQVGKKESEFFSMQVNQAKATHARDGEEIFIYVTASKGDNLTLNHFAKRMFKVKGVSLKAGSKESKEIQDKQKDNNSDKDGQDGQGDNDHADENNNNSSEDGNEEDKKDESKTVQVPHGGAGPAMAAISITASAKVTIGGKPAKATTLRTDVPAEGGPVLLTPTGAELTFIPASVTVPTGASESDAFKIQASGKAAAGQIALSVAAVGGAGNTNNLSANPFEVQGVVLNKKKKKGKGGDDIEDEDAKMSGPQINTITLSTDKGYNWWQAEQSNLTLHRRNCRRRPNRVDPFVPWSDLRAPNCESAARQVPI